MVSVAKSLPTTAIAYRSPLGAKQSRSSPAPNNVPPEQSVNGIGTCCQFRPLSRETAATIFWNGPWIQVATIFFGFTGFTATNGSSASSSVQFPGTLGNPESQLPAAFGRESSISGPRVAAEPEVGSTSE